MPAWPGRLGLSWFFDVSPAELVERPAVPRPTATRHPPRRSCSASLAACSPSGCDSDGVGALYEQVRAGPALLDAVLGRPNGDRDLTDLDHLAELLVAELAG